MADMEKSLDRPIKILIHNEWIRFTVDQAIILSDELLQKVKEFESK